MNSPNPNTVKLIQSCDTDATLKLKQGERPLSSTMTPDNDKQYLEAAVIRNTDMPLSFRS